MSEELDDFIDACDVDYNDHALAEDDVDLFVLFPDGKDEELERAYKELFKD